MIKSRPTHLENQKSIPSDRYALFDHLPEGVVIVGADLNVIYCNEAALRLARLSPDGISGLKLSDIFPDHPDTSISSLAVQCLTRRQPCVFEYDRNQQSGAHAWLELRAYPVEEGLLLMCYDLRQRKNQEAAAEQLQQELSQQLRNEMQEMLQKTQTEITDYKHALDESCIVAITDQKGVIRYVNENFCRISKYSKEELIGQDHRIINSAFHPKPFIRQLWVTIANGHIWRGEIRNRAKDGSYYWVDTTIVPFLNDEGKPYQYLAIRSDITQRKLAEEELIRHKEELENKVKDRTLELTQALEREKELNEMKSRFVSMASHEFRTPLSAILSSISLVDHYTTSEQTENRKKHVDRIKTAVRNLTSLLDDFLSLEKLEQGKVETHPVEFDLNEFLEDVIEDMEGMLKKKSQSILYSFEGNAAVFLDKKILRNVLLNLLSNAVKYSSEGKQIALTAHATGSRGRIMVKDEGIGIPEEAQKQLFDKFFRADNATNIQGTGLGLNIVKRYVDLLDGSIHFTSRENEGSTFTVEFPVHASS